VAELPAKRSEPRIPFSALIEAGLIAPGVILTDDKRRHRAVVRADGAVAIGDIIGSIHKAGALVQGLPACNGWTFWHYERAGRLQPIDALRAAFRREMRNAAA
jgi:modification methylase